MSEERKVSLGVVGVDSGQLMIIDPCYINSEWKVDGNPIAVKFWGRDEDKLSSLLKNLGYTISEEDVKYVSCTNMNAEDTLNMIKKTAKENDLLIVSTIETDNSFDTVCKLTSDEEKQGGQLHYKLGHEGLGVAFRSGFGDGMYEVFATIKDCSQWGERISKVEIVLIEDDELDD
ncbi:hypothetical protein [Lysinibacillus cavernae]|uniref:hypothetical protein n=1 Tax=Lysinibacillus cavernae TaxID=2666135 RepID=UPI0012D8F1C6|nr:hypothetical protein [Lysinibacillus cavernae]